MKKKDLLIYPLNLGTLVSIDKSVFTLLRNQGSKIDAPILAWAILGGTKNILVDTGPCDMDWASRYHRPIKKESSQEIVNALKKIGLSPNDVDLVILTHLHWDHCFNLEYFPNATFFVQREELKYAVDPLPMDKRPYEIGIPEIQPPWMKIFGKIIVTGKEDEIIPGVRVMHLPGHTPGMQGVVVNTSAGEWIIAGDNVPLYDNWEGDNALKHIPSPVYQNMYDYNISLNRIDSFGNNVLPGHDYKVLKNETYPIVKNK